jgi:S-adenosylmethionine-diacylglycerol 3-amino-3-carboxypropyl transferase
MPGTEVQFAVVREDPTIERRVLREHPTERALLVGSGGCTALCLQSWWPDMRFTLVDPNPAQLDLIRKKVAALQGGVDEETGRRFNVGDDDPAGLSQCGSFEGLFRSLRRFVHEFVAPAEDVESWFDSGTTRSAVAGTFANPYWKVAFEVFFADSMLHAMFGPAATRYATPGSYPAYFRARIERGLTAESAAQNYFLHSIFLGAYRADCLPAFLREPPGQYRFDWVEGPLDAVRDLSAHGFVDLSNIMDWMSPAECKPTIQRLCSELRPGAMVLWRQLNNETDRCAWFGAAYDFDIDRGRELAALDQSLFYNSVHIGTKR